MAGRRSRRRVSSGAAQAAQAAGTNRRRNILWIGGIVGALVLAVVLVGAFITQGFSAGETDGTVPNFDFTLYQGERTLGTEKLDFAALQGQPIVLNFWAGLCPPCRAEMPGFQRVYDDTREDVLLLGIDVGQFTGLGNRRDARNLLQELGVSYPAGFTNDRGVMRDYRVSVMPATVFISPRGEVVRTWNGALDENSLRAFTLDLLLGDSESTP